MAVLTGERVRLEPLEARHGEALRAIHLAPEVAAWWGRPEDDFPHSDEPDAHRYAIVIGGEIAGMIQYGEEPEPEYRHAWIDVFVAPAHHGRGHGTDALRRLVAFLIAERGHHRITIDPALENTAAVRSYAKAGFEPVGVMRAAWRDPADGRWRDVLMMELIAPGAAAVQA